MSHLYSITVIYHACLTNFLLLCRIFIQPLIYIFCSFLKNVSVLCYKTLTHFSLCLRLYAIQCLKGRALAQSILGALSSYTIFSKSFLGHKATFGQCANSDGISRGIFYMDKLIYYLTLPLRWGTICNPILCINF